MFIYRTYKSTDNENYKRHDFVTVKPLSDEGKTQIDIILEYKTSVSIEKLFHCTCGVTLASQSIKIYLVI